MADLRTEIRELVGSTADVVSAARALRHAHPDQVLERLRELAAAVDAFERGELAAIGKQAPAKRNPRTSRRFDRSAALGATELPERPSTEAVEESATEPPPPDPEPEASSVHAAPAPELPRHERIKARLREAMARRSEAASG